MKDLLKKEIAVSILVSIIVTVLFQPLFQFIWVVLLNFSASVYSGWLNKIYVTAAYGVNNRTEVTLLTIFFSVLLPVVTTSGTQFYLKTLKPIFSNEDDEEEEPLESLQKIEIEQTEKQIEKNNDEIKKENVEIEKFKRTLKILSALGVFSVSLVMFTIFGILVKEFASMELNTSFNQRLTILAPKLTDQEYEEFKASWASMDSREDYLDIQNEMDKVASQYQIKLPKPLLN